MLLEFSLADTGEITSPIFHDAHLTGIFLPRQDYGSLLIQNVKGEKYTLSLIGIQRLRADDLRQGNIILDVTVSKKLDICAEDVAYAYGVGQKDEPFVLRLLDQIRVADTVVVRINPSYGCSVVCVCDSLSICAGWYPGGI